jgi:hypothetical protein
LPAERARRGAGIAFYSYKTARCHYRMTAILRPLFIVKSLRNLIFVEKVSAIG